MKYLVHPLVVLLLVLVAPTASSQSKPASQSKPVDSTLVTAGQLFSTYDYRATETEDLNAFHLDRAQFDVLYSFEALAGFHLSLEAIRSAGPDSLFGVDQNSILARFKFGYGFATPTLGPGEITLRAGLIPDLWIESIERGYDLRGLSPLGAESSGFFDTSDLGASAQYAVFDGVVRVGVSATNGEGRNQVELNNGKNTTLVVDARPVTVNFWGGEAILGLHAGYRDGSTGLGQLRNHRATGAVTLRHPRLGAGFEYERAFGYLGRGSREARVVSGWANAVVLPPHLAVFGRYEHLDTNLDQQDATINTIQAGFYGDVFAPLDNQEARRLRLYVGYRRDAFGDGVGPVPGVPDAANIHTAFATLEARGLLSSSVTTGLP